MTRDRDVYEMYKYREFKTQKNLQDAGGNLMAVGIGEVGLRLNQLMVNLGRKFYTMF